MERLFFEYFESSVSEWNPNRDDHGGTRACWDEELQADDWEVPVDSLIGGLWNLMQGKWVDARNPGRVRLRNVLDAVYREEAAGNKVDLQPLRRLVALLVEASERHTWHSDGSFAPPVCYSKRGPTI